MGESSIRVEPLEARQLLSVTPTPAANAGPAAPLAGVSQTVSATPQPTPGGRAFGEYAQVKFTAKIGTFHFKTVDQLLRAVIHWSDGTHSTGTVEGSYASGDWYVEGTHTYAKPGVYKVNVNVYAYLPGSPNLVTSPFTHFTSVVTVTDLKPTGGGVSLIETATQSFTAKLGEFKYKTVDQILNAVIDWGDGTHSDGKLIGSYATGEWYVQGTHTYALVGKYKVDVKVFGHPAGTTIHPTSPLAQFTSVVTVMGHA